jgi:hypothetical protein
MDKEIVTQYMIFRKFELVGKTQQWAVLNKSGGYPLGRILFYYAWRQYIFQPATDTEFNCSCLDTISGFLKRLNAEQRNGS